MLYTLGQSAAKPLTTCTPVQVAVATPVKKRSAPAGGSSTGARAALPADDDDDDFVQPPSNRARRSDV